MRQIAGAVGATILWSMSVSFLLETIRFLGDKGRRRAELSRFKAIGLKETLREVLFQPATPNKDTQSMPTRSILRRRQTES